MAKICANQQERRGLAACQGRHGGVLQKLIAFPAVNSHRVWREGLTLNTTDMEERVEWALQSCLVDGSQGQAAP
jgi:hypothetical protein